MNYKDQLLDPRWQRKRLEVLQRDDFKCFKCHDSTTTLHVHHRYYVSGRAPWEYPQFCFVTLCEDCHYHLPVELDYARANELDPFESWEVFMDVNWGLIHGLTYPIVMEAPETR